MTQALSCSAVAWAPSLGERKTRRPARTWASAARTLATAACTRRERDGTPPRSSAGSTSTATSTAIGAIAKATRPRWRWLKRSTVENMTIPRPTSATTLSSVCETIEPTTVGRLSRGRPVRRATISAREGSPRRAGSVADMSTPMNVPCRASERRRRASGSAAVRIACHATPRTTIEPHIRPRPSSTQVGVARSRLSPIWSRPMRCSASRASNPAARPARPMPALRAAARRRSRPSRLDASRLGRRRSAGRRGPRSAGTAPRNTPARSRAVDGPRHGDGVGVGLEDLAGDGRPGVARRVRARLDGHGRALLGRHGEVAQRLGQGGGVAARHEHAVDPVAHDVAVAGDVGGDDRRAGGEGLGEHHAEALAAQRGRDEQVGRGQGLRLLGVGDLAQDVDALRAVEHERLDLVAVGADDR